MVTVTESCGVVRVSGKSKYFVAVCSECGACVTITIKQRLDDTKWLFFYLDENIPCCDKPHYYWGDFEHYHHQS